MTALAGAAALPAGAVRTALLPGPFERLAVSTPLSSVHDIFKEGFSPFL
jgi:hypothetical protein